MSKWVWGAVLVLAIVIVYVLVGQSLIKSMPQTEAQATEFARNELNWRYPGAEIEIYEVTNTSNVANQSSWLVKSKVTTGKSTLCPNLTIVEMDQKFSFTPRERIITENCEVLGCKGVPNCIIAFEEEAILMPLDAARNPAAKTAINSYLSGMMETEAASATARLAATHTSPTNQTYNDVWVVDYSYPSAAQRFEAVLNKTGGTALETYSPKN